MHALLANTTPLKIRPAASSLPPHSSACGLLNDPVCSYYIEKSPLEGAMGIE